MNTRIHEYTSFIMNRLIENDGYKNLLTYVEHCVFDRNWNFTRKLYKCFVCVILSWMLEAYVSAEKAKGIK